MPTGRDGSRGPDEQRATRQSSDYILESEAGRLVLFGESTLDAPRRLVDLSTGLPSLTSLFRELRPIAEDPGGLTVLYVHIPSCAIVEERFGWEALEAYRGIIASYLAGTAQVLRRERSHCVLARAYADDFVVLAPQREKDDELSTKLADGITRHLAAIDPETAALLQVFVGVVHSRPFPRIHPERLIYRMVQQAQAEAMDVVRQQLSAKVRLLDRCLTKNCFNMVYQPIVRLRDHSIFAYEALVRCTQEELRSPHVLLNVAEQGGRIQALSRRLRGIAAQAVSELPAGTEMFINTHADDFDDQELLDPHTVMASGAERIVLEVTERAAITDKDKFLEKLSELREIGYRIAIDDLGSGYSALGLVAELSPDFVKLDMTLVRGLDASPVRQNLIRNILSFAADMNAQVVAEGVETRAELEVLHELECHLVQGYYLSMPKPPFVTRIEEPPLSAHR